LGTKKDKNSTDCTGCDFGHLRFLTTINGSRNDFIVVVVVVVVVVVGDFGLCSKECRSGNADCILTLQICISEMQI
jgi:hypothetical protein